MTRSVNQWRSPDVSTRAFVVGSIALNADGRAQAAVGQPAAREPRINADGRMQLSDDLATPTGRGWLAVLGTRFRVYRGGA
jgi:hypothetical protein